MTDSPVFTMDLTDVLICRVCKVPAGQPCRTRTGRLAHSPHEWRLAHIYEDDLADPAPKRRREP